MASLVQRGAVYYIAWRERGKQKRVSTGITRKKDAERALRAWERNRTEDNGSHDVTCEDFWPLYLEWMERHRARNTIEGKRVHWNRYLEEFEPVRLSDVTQADVERLKGVWIDAGRHPVSINNFLRAMKSLYNDAQKLHLGSSTALYAGPNPFIGVLPAPTKKQPKRTLTQIQCDKLLEVAEKHAGRAYNRNTPQADRIDLVVALCLFGGLRKAEVIEAKWGWVDFEGRLLRITQSDAFTTKSKLDRDIPLHPRLADLLKPHRGEEDAYIYMPGHTPENPIRYRCNPHRSFKYVAAKAGVPWAGFHSLRHTFVTRLIKGGADLVKVSQWAGHSSLEVTADIYSHLTGAYDSDIEKLV